MEYIENKLVEEEQTRGIFQDMAKYAPSKIVGTLGNALIVPVYTSLLPPEQYGLYTISIALLSFLCIIFSDWVGLSGLRFFRHHQIMQDMPKYLTTLVSMLTFNILMMLLVAYVFRENFYSFFHIPVKYFLAILLLIIPVAARALLFQLIRAQLKSMSFTFSTIMNQFLTIGLSVFFVKYFHLGAMGMLLGMGVSISLIDLLLIYQSNIVKWFKLQKVEWTFLIPIWKYGVPIAATSLSAWIINQSNKFIMNSIKGFSEAGIVGVGYGLTLPLLLTVFAIITVAAIPRIINMYEEKIDVRPIISRFVGYYLLISLPMITVMSLYCVDYVNIFANEKFYTAFKLIPYFAFGTFFLAITDYTTLQYHLANKTYIDFVIKLISGIVGVVLNIVLIPSHGLAGVGIATLAANILYFLLTIIIVLPDLRLRFPYKTVSKMILAGMPFAGLYFVFLKFNFSHAIFEMISLLVVFYAFYWFFGRIFSRLSKD